MFRKTVFTLIAVTLISACNNGGTFSSPGVTYNDYSNSLAVRGPVKVRTMNFSQVNSFLYRGGVPKEEDINALKNDFNVKTMISFRGMGVNESAQVAEEKSISSRLNLKFFNLAVPFDRPIPEKMVRQFFEIVDKQQNDPVYAHCTHGRDRTGTMIALYRISHDKISGPQALSEMQTFGFKPKDYPIFAKQVLDSTPEKLAF